MKKLLFLSLIFLATLNVSGQIRSFMCHQYGVLSELGGEIKFQLLSNTRFIDIDFTKKKIIVNWYENKKEHYIYYFLLTYKGKKINTQGLKYDSWDALDDDNIKCIVLFFDTEYIRNVVVNYPNVALYYILE